MTDRSSRPRPHHPAWQGQGFSWHNLLPGTVSLGLLLGERMALPFPQLPYAYSLSEPN